MSRIAADEESLNSPHFVSRKLETALHSASESVYNGVNHGGVWPDAASLGPGWSLAALQKSRIVRRHALPSIMGIMAVIRPANRLP